MQSLNDDERKAVLGEVLADEIHAMYQYIKDIGVIKKDVTANKEASREHNDRLNVLEHVVRAHETDLKQLKAQ